MNAVTGAASGGGTGATGGAAMVVVVGAVFGTGCPPAEATAGTAAAGEAMLIAAGSVFASVAAGPALEISATVGMLTRGCADASVRRDLASDGPDTDPTRLAAEADGAPARVRRFGPAILVGGVRDAWVSAAADDDSEALDGPSAHATAE